MSAKFTPLEALKKIAEIGTFAPPGWNEWTEEERKKFTDRGWGPIYSTEAKIALEAIQLATE